jgi:sulfate adenylyltransferase subunit 2
VTLLETIAEYKFDACIGGARRDEEKARAKERIFSFRDEFGQWDPKAQRPELWDLYNTRVHPGENMRVFPISNWTELDVWQYIQREKLALPPIYFAHERQVIPRNGLLVPLTDLTPAREGEAVETQVVRFRTVGDISCTCPVSLGRGDGRSDHRRNRGHPDHRTRRHPDGRPDLRSVDGKTQESRILLMNAR